MRLYIPTSSLNADNILSCESIATPYECRKRNFGYSHFDVLPELERFNKVTLAFSKIPTFHTSDIERESFAMIVAVDVEDFEKSDFRRVCSVNGVEVFATSSPILISPSTAQFLFFDYRAKEYTLHSCADSAKCKLFDFYKSNFSIADNRQYGESLRVYIDKVDVPENEPIFSENRYDKSKGFIWGYGIGTMMSIPQDAAKLLKIQKRIYDIVSSTKNENYIPANLSDELSRLDIEYSSIDPNQKAIKIAWEAYIKESTERFLHTEIQVSEVDEFLKYLGAENLVKNKFLTDKHYTLRKRLSDYTRLGNFGYESYSHDLASYTERLINSERIKAASKPFSQSLDVDTVTYETVMMSSDDRSSKLFNKFLSRIIWDNLIPSLEELRVNKANVAKNAVITIKSIIEELGEQWANAPIQLYFNSMRKNISEFTEFDLNEIQDIVLQSVAAFLLKGEDFESLKQYLEANAFSDYRYAFALWGVVSGYVSMPRSIIESEFNDKDTAHLFSEAQIALNLNPVISIHYESAPESGGTIIPSQPDTDHNTISFRNKVIAYFEKIKKGKRNQDQMREELLAALNQLGDSDNSFLFICTLNDFSKWRNSSKAWQEMQAEFCPDYAEQIGKGQPVSNQRPLKVQKTPGFWDKIGGLFQRGNDYDESVETPLMNGETSSIRGNIEFNLQNIDAIVDLIFQINPFLSKEALKYIKKDLEWVFDPKYTNGKSQSDLIETFKSVLTTGKTEPFSKTGKDMKWKNDAYISLDVEKTIRRIKDSTSH